MVSFMLKKPEKRRIRVKGGSRQEFSIYYLKRQNWLKGKFPPEPVDEEKVYRSVRRMPSGSCKAVIPILKQRGDSLDKG